MIKWRNQHINNDISNIVKSQKLKDMPIQNNSTHLKIGVGVFTIINQRLNKNYKLFDFNIY